MTLLPVCLALIGCALVAGAAEPLALPSAEPAVIEFHGEFRQPGQEALKPFWIRIKAGDPQYAGHRLAELVYTAPAPATIAGTVLVDHPYLLLDDHLRLMAWNGREGLAKITALTSGGYQVVREVTVGEGIAALGRESARTLSDALAWDQRLAPLLLAACWRADSQGQVPTVDFYGDQPASVVRWTGSDLHLNGQGARIEADERGACARIVAQDGTLWFVRAPATASPQDRP
jgi:hypothetical protein